MSRQLPSVSKKLEAPPIPTKTTVTVPLAEVPAACHISRRVDVAHLTRRQAETLKRVQRSLEDSGGVMANGRPVRRCSDAIKWLIDQIADANAS
ncbi:MAG: hypothetical protein IT427_12850 [Pirellulales bacterium]|nr:hypothetical protein [Pirellulales bacterium]